MSIVYSVLTVLRLRKTELILLRLIARYFEVSVLSFFHLLAHGLGCVV